MDALEQSTKPDLIRPFVACSKRTLNLRGIDPHPNKNVGVFLWNRPSGGDPGTQRTCQENNMTEDSQSSRSVSPILPLSLSLSPLSISLPSLYHSLPSLYHSLPSISLSPLSISLSPLSLFLLSLSFSCLRYFTHSPLMNFPILFFTSQI